LYGWTGYRNNDKMKFFGNRIESYTLAKAESFQGNSLYCVLMKIYWCEGKLMVGNAKQKEGMTKEEDVLETTGGNKPLDGDSQISDLSVLTDQGMPISESESGFVDDTSQNIEPLNIAPEEAPSYQSISVAAGQSKIPIYRGHGGKKKEIPGMKAANPRRSLRLEEKAKKEGNNPKNLRRSLRLMKKDKVRYYV